MEEIIKNKGIPNRYWVVMPHPKGLGFYPKEIIKKTEKKKVIELDSKYFAESNNFATTDLVKTVINKRIDYLKGADLSPLKKIKNYGRNYKRGNYG